MARLLGAFLRETLSEKAWFHGAFLVVVGLVIGVVGVVVTGGGEGGMLSRASSQPPLPQQAVPEGAPAAALAWLGLGFLWLLARVLLGFSSIFGLWLRAWLWLGVGLHSSGFGSGFGVRLIWLWLDFGWIWVDFGLILA